MNITNALKIALKNILSIKMGSVQTDKAVLVWDGEEDLKAGDEVYVMDENGDAVPAPDGEYTTEDGKAIIVAEGRVQEINDPEAEISVEETIEEVQQEEVQQEEVEQEVNEEVAPADEPEEEEPAEEISIEDRVADLEGRIGAIVEGIDQIINALAGFEQRIAELEGKMASVEAPAAEPIDEQPKVEETTHKSRLSYLRKD